MQEHIDLIASIRNGKPLNEGRQVAESTLMAIMGRMSAYTGRAMSWDWAMNTSKLDLTPAKYEFGPNPVDRWRCRGRRRWSRTGRFTVETAEHAKTAETKRLA